MSVVPLSREYACQVGGKAGGPVLRAVDPRIFSLRYFMHCLSCGFCHDACCAHGVDVDLENVARLKAAPQDFKDYIGVPEEEWFTAEPIPDPEFAGGGHLRTRVRDGACVFLSRDPRGCKLHAWSLKQGTDYHLLKPIVSILFPVTFDHGVLGPSGEVADKSLICEGEGPSCYQGARAELGYYFGAGLVAELDGLSGTAR